MCICIATPYAEYSLLDGTGTSLQYAEEAARLNQDALAQTDHGNLGGALHHIQACQDVGIKPIVGVEAYFRPNRKDHSQDNKQYFHLVLLAKNQAGWKSLLGLTSEAFASGFYYKPCVDFELLEKYKDGLWVSSACVSGYLPRQIEKGDVAEINRYIEWLHKHFPDSFSIEIMPNQFDLQKAVNVELVNIAQRIGAPLVATVDAHYPYKEWADTQDVMLMMATGQTISKRKAKKEAGEDVYEFGEKNLYMMSEQEVREAFARAHPNIPQPIIDEAIANTSLIASKCEAFEVDKSQKLPRVQGGEEQALRIVRGWVEEGLEQVEARYRFTLRGDEWDNGLAKTYRDQVEYELGVMKDLGVLSYIVIVASMVRAAKKRMLVGPGRGSASGSLVSYLIRMTSIDPIQHGLMFERFINPHRREMPDVDSDFPRESRQWVKDWLAEEYGRDHVADIIAHQTFAPKAALQGVGRVFDVPYEDMTKVTKSMEDVDASHKLEDLVDLFPELGKFKEKYPEVWKHALRIQGQVKAVSKHAGGVVITDKPVTEYMPTQRGNKGDIVTAWGARTGFNIIDKFGFTKIDVLGIVDLDKQQYALDLIEQRTGERIDINALPVLYDPYDVEPEVMDAFKQGLTFGVFQFESRNITAILKQVKPDNVNDITAINAGWRPGGIGSGAIFELGPRKNGEQPWKLWHESVGPILNETHGLVLYQEQVIRVVQALGGFTLAEADIVRKSITKNYKTTGAKDLEAFKEKFLKGCVERGVLRDKGEEIWAKLMEFARYGFNKAHACGYAIMAYQDMWLKVHYPLEFYAAQLTFEPGKVARALREAQASGIKILPPDVNTSDAGFTLDGDAIRFGLEAIKNVGKSAVEAIKWEREKYGKFKDLQDFLDRMPSRKVNSRVRTALQYCGAFDSFGERDMWDDATKMKHEKELLGYALSKSSIAQHRDLIKSKIITEVEYDARPRKPKSHKRHCACDVCREAEVAVGGEVVDMKEITTRKGDKMAFVDLAFGGDTYNATFFPAQWANYEGLVKSGDPILVKGTKNDRDAVAVDYACSVDDLAAALAARQD